MTIEKYGDRQDFMVKFNPAKQVMQCADVKDCFFGEAPTLSTINLTYGKMTAAMWLVPQLYDLSEFCGCKDKLQGKQLEECAKVIAMEFSYLKVTEVMLFFHRFKSGRYGRFYGSVDPLVITTSLRTFLEERMSEYDMMERQKSKERMMKEREEAVPYEDYLKMKEEQKKSEEG